MARPPSVNREPPLGDALGPTINRLRAIAMQSYDTLLLADGPPQPDYALLDLCSETLHTIKAANAAREARRAARWATSAASDWQDLDAMATRLLKRVAKVKATTAAGLYAKALVCRSTAAGSAVLAHSLAEDFIECEGLRASIWPAGGAS